jgi:Fe-S-cluster-containing dehydrogenase component
MSSHNCHCGGNKPSGGGCGSGGAGGGQPGDLSRRSFLRNSLLAVSGIAALAASLSPLRELTDFTSTEEFLQKHYREMTPADMDKALERISSEVEKRYSLRPHLRDYKPMDGVEFVYALNLTRCIGCRKCVHACVAENNQSITPELQYIRVLKMPNGTFDLEKGDHKYEPSAVREPGFFYMPVQCHQCHNPPCVKVCPVKATWQEKDGITVIDYDWCIGCRYCEAACPYFARRFNFTEPGIPKEKLNPNMSYLGNRPRHKGVMEKCHFCIQRTRAGKYPACLEVCPTGARKFGNILDPNSEVSYILKNKRVFVLKEEVGTLPRFFYYFDV